MTAQAFTLFDTAIGPCGLAWTRRGIVGVQLPMSDASETRGRMVRRLPAAAEAPPPPAVAAVIADIVALLNGEARELAAAEIDLDGVPGFDRGVYQVARTIPPGRTLTYGEIASRLGLRDARAVGQALGRNPVPIIVPCHRVVAAGGRIGGFSAHGGSATKRRLLAIEGAGRDDGPTLFDLMA